MVLNSDFNLDSREEVRVLLIANVETTGAKHILINAKSTLYSHWDS